MLKCAEGGRDVCRKVKHAVARISVRKVVGISAERSTNQNLHKACIRSDWLILHPIGWEFFKSGLYK